MKPRAVTVILAIAVIIEAAIILLLWNLNPDFLLSLEQEYLLGLVAGEILRNFVFLYVPYWLINKLYRRLKRQ